MRYESVRIAAITYELPPIVVTTREIEDRLEPCLNRLGIPVGHIEELTGVEERRWWEPGASLAEKAAKAAHFALDRTGIPSERLGALVYGGVCREQFEPATACRVAANLNIARTAAIYDLSNACLGALNGLLEVANRIELGQIEAGLVVAAESARDINEIAIERLNRQPDLREFTQGLATFTGGSGAIALLACHESLAQDLDESHRLLGGVHLNAPEHHRLCRWGVTAPLAGGVADRVEFMETDSVGVLNHGVELGRTTWDAFLAELDWPGVDKTICHQVGSAHQRTILAAIGSDPDRDFVTYPYLGNIGTVSLPITAQIASEQRRLNRGERVGWLGIGSGLNCMMLGVEW